MRNTKLKNEELNEIIDLIECGKYEQALEDLLLTTGTNKLKECDQNNPHHKYNVYDHIIIATEYVEYGLRSVVSHMTLEDNKQWFIDNEEVLLTLFKLVMLLHDIGKPDCKKVNQKTGYDSFIKHEKLSGDIANFILPDDFDYKTVVLWLIKNHEYINENTCNNKKSIRKRWISTDKNTNLMFMLPMLRLADISAQSKYKYADKFEENSSFCYYKFVQEDL